MKMLVNCIICGKEININPSRYSENGNCCSVDCLSVKNSGSNNVKCYICKKDFHVKPFHLNRMKNPERICCSFNCSKKEKSDRLKKEGNHQFGLLGELNSSFKSDIRLTTYGYIAIRDINHPLCNYSGFVLFHRVCIEEFLLSTKQFDNLSFDKKTKRYYLPHKYVVYHKNENKLDNRLDNLQIMLKSEHVKLHNINNPVNRNEFNGQFEKGKIKKGKLLKKHFNDAGLDIFSNEDIEILPGKSAIINTNLYISIPKNHVGLIWSRSGLSVKNKIEVGAGCIDENFTGEIKVHLYNFNDSVYNVKKEDRIAQLLTIPINLQEYEQVDELDETVRGEGGFGSTGK